MYQMPALTTTEPTSVKHFSNSLKRMTALTLEDKKFMVKSLTQKQRVLLNANSLNCGQLQSQRQTWNT